MIDLISTIFQAVIGTNEEYCFDSMNNQILIDSFGENIRWLVGNLDDGAKKHVLELTEIRHELIKAASCDSFRRGFTFGAGLVMDVYNGIKQEDDNNAGK